MLEVFLAQSANKFPGFLREETPSTLATPLKPNCRLNICQVAPANMAKPFEAICGCSFSGDLVQQGDEAAQSKGTCQGKQNVAEIRCKIIKRTCRMCLGGPLLLFGTHAHMNEAKG